MWRTASLSKWRVSRQGEPEGKGGLGGFVGLTADYNWEEGAAGRVSSSCQSRSPPATKGLLWVEGAAAESGLPTLALG